MKLHPDGIIEGSPQEILEYKRLVKPKGEREYPELKGIQSPLMPNPLHPAITCDSTKEGIYVSKQPSQAKF
ncbi:hypothetical protein ABEW32_03610 [Paenibacillus jamilae]|uniref:hypothetical protein n=1 Tax=Paenibacillus jamilae TaxID=114136 RepID=UPI003D26C3AF